MEGGGGSNGTPAASNPSPPPPPQAHVGLEMEDVHQQPHQQQRPNNNPSVPIAATTTTGSPTTGRALRTRGMSGGSLGSFNSLSGSQQVNRRPASGSFAATVRAQRRKEQLEQRREERDAADELFQLGWTVIAGMIGSCIFWKGGKVNVIFHPTYLSSLFPLPLPSFPPYRFT